MRDRVFRYGAGESIAGKEKMPPLGSSNPVQMYMFSYFLCIFVLRGVRMTFIYGETARFLCPTEAKD